MKKVLLFISMTFSISLGYSELKNSILVPVMIDEKTEIALGKFPFDRKYIADSIEILAKLEAKAVIIKFFYDLPKDNGSDRLLSEALSKIPTFLQATITNEENPNALNTKFVYQNQFPGSDRLIEGTSGWIPMPEFANRAYDMGFVDIKKNSNNEFPLFEKYGSQVVKTLTFSVIKFCYPNINIEYQKKIVNGMSFISLNDNNDFKIQLPKNDELTYISLIDLINGKVNKKDIDGKIIYLGYDGVNQGFFDTEIGKIKSHRYYFYGLDYILKSLGSGI